MAFIKCPKCGQTALSIASVCPKCGHLLMQHTPPQGESDALVRCPRCRKFIERTASECEFCSFPLVFWRRARWGAIAVLVLALAAVSVVGLRSLWTSAPPPRVAQPPAADQPTRAPTVPADTGPVVAPTIVVEEVPTRDSTDAMPVVQPEPVETVTTLDRWVVTWANLREGPGLDYPVIRILLPGVRVRVAQPSRGFAAVYGPDGLEGYVAVSLLSDRELPRDSLARVQPQ